MRRYIIIGLFLVLIGLSGCIFDMCNDGTLYGKCSTSNLYYYCTPDGNLVKDENICSLEKFNLDNNFSDDEKKCSDGTKSGICGKNKPNYCDKGILIENVIVCGCPEKMEIVGNKCIEIDESKVWDGEFSYNLRGETGQIKVSLDKELKKYLSKLPRTYTCNPVCPSMTQIELKPLDNKKQMPALEKIVQKIKEKTSNLDDQARIAISLVQKIPYDMNALLTNNLYARYPYEVIYDNKGVCGEKSKLMAFFLRELGFGTALLYFEKENHETVGIKCPIEYCYKNTGYCFIESTIPSIITDSDGNYFRVGKLESIPEVLKISDGNSFDSVVEEVEDDLRYKKLFEILDEKNLKEWLYLRNKYGFQTTRCDANQTYCNGFCHSDCEEDYILICSNKGGYCISKPD